MGGTFSKKRAANHKISLDYGVPVHKEAAAFGYGDSSHLTNNNIKLVNGVISRPAFQNGASRSSPSKNLENSLKTFDNDHLLTSKQFQDSRSFCTSGDHTLASVNGRRNFSFVTGTSDSDGEYFRLAADDVDGDGDNDEGRVDIGNDVRRRRGKPVSGTLPRFERNPPGDGSGRRVGGPHTGSNNNINNAPRYATLQLSNFRRSFKRWSMKRQSANKSQGSWKFWRRLSIRSKNEAKTKASGDKSDAGLLDKDTEDVFETQTEVTSLPPSRALPDVVEKAHALPLFSSNAVPPPKPPRLFLIRSPGDINRNSSSEPNGEAGNDRTQQAIEKDNDPTYVNCERVRELKSQLLTGDQSLTKPSAQQASTGENNDIVIDKSPFSALAGIEEEQTGKEAGKKNEASSKLKDTTSSGNNNNNISTIGCNGMAASVSPATSRAKGNFAYQSSTTPRKPKIVTPELSFRRAGRHRRKSNEKGDMTRQRHIMNSVAELMCQRLDPYPLLDFLKHVGVLTNGNVQNFLSNHDRKSVCEGLTELIGNGQPEYLLHFCDGLSMAGGGCTEILEVLQIMLELYRTIQDIPEANVDDKSVFAEEKNINFDIGYLASDYSLKPLVELERVRMLGDKRLSKASSRNSAYSLLETEAECASRMQGGDGTFYPGLVMMSVSITGYSLSGKRAESLADVIRHHNCISELHLGKTQMTGRDVEVVAKALVSNSTIHSLDLRLNSIGMVGAQAVAKLLQETRFLRILNLSSSGLDTDCFRVLASSVSGNKTLVELDASFLDINDESCRFLKDMLRGNTCLQRLRLRSNNLTWSGCYTLCEGLARNRTLLALDLSRNQIGDAGTEALAKYLPESSVNELCVENCGIGTGGSEFLAELVSHCKKLRHLDISTNDVFDAGVSKLAPALERSSSITNVSMNMCGVTNDGFSKLLDVLEKNTSIVQLKLCYNTLGKEHTNEAATSDNLRYRLRIVTSSKPKLKILLWGNAFDDPS